MLAERMGANRVLQSPPPPRLNSQTEATSHYKTKFDFLPVFSQFYPNIDLFIRTHWLTHTSERTREQNVCVCVFMLGSHLFFCMLLLLVLLLLALVLHHPMQQSPFGPNPFFSVIFFSPSLLSHIVWLQLQPLLLETGDASLLWHAQVFYK